MASRARLVLSCEHGGNEVPAAHRALFARHARVLASHRGYDFGALHLARHLARTLSAPLSAAAITRLLCDLNRSAKSSSVFSEITRPLPPAARARILKLHHEPYRAGLARSISRADRGHVLHVAVHSFTPRLGGRTRRADIGILYDPGRPREAAWARRWRGALLRELPDLRVRRNYPYRGTDDGLTTYFRTLWSDVRYAGLELEVNQALLRRPPSRRMLDEAIARSLAAILEDAIPLVGR